MKITHIALNGPVTDHWTYQDNLLPKYHKKCGFEVSMITSKYIYNSQGQITVDSRDVYENENQIKTIRLPIKGNKPIGAKFKRYLGLYQSIERENPQILFVHTVQFLDIKTIVKYAKKHPDVVIYADNHADLSNSASGWLSKNILHRLVWRHYAKMIQPYVKKFYGVLPARVDFLKDIYGIESHKAELLVMGADDEMVEQAQNEEVIQKIRRENNIQGGDFFIITGGKMDSNKRQVLLLMDAVNGLKIPHVKLVVFGSVAQEIKGDFTQRLSDRVRYIDWVPPQRVYEYFNASDLVVFPGLHSVFWEQVVGLGKPAVFRYIEGFTHIDLHGNCAFFREDKIEHMQSVLEEIILKEELFDSMKRVAKEKGIQFFSYFHIARRSVSD